MKIEPQVRPRLQGRDDPAAAQDRPEGHGRRAHAGHARPRAGCTRAARSRSRQTLPDVNLDEILASLDADTRDYLQLLLNDGGAGPRQRQGPRARRRRSARFEPTAQVRARDQRGARRARARNITRVVHNFSLLTDELGGKRRRSSRLRRRTRTRCSPRSRARTRALRAIAAASCPATLHDDADDARQGRDAGRRARPDAARRCGPARARSARRCARRGRSCARRRRSSATRSARSRAPRCRRSRSCARRCATSRRRRRTSPRSFKVVNRLLNEARLQPARRQRRGLPVLAVVGQPRRQLALLHRRTRTARSAAAWSCSRCQTAQLLDAVAAGQPAARHARSSCSTRPTHGRSARARPRRRRRRLMVKDAPSLGQIAAMVLFALSCFGLLLFLWLAFGGPVPLKPKGYRFHTSFAEAAQLAHGGRRADLRRAGRQGQDDRARQADRAARDVDDPARVALRAAAVGRARRSCARRRCWARPTSSSRRARQRAEADPGGRRRWPTSQVSRRRSSSTRSCARSTRRRARRSRTGCRRRRRRSTAAGRTSTTRSATSAPFAEDTRDARRHPQPPAGRGRAADRQHRRRLRRADRARRPAALADRELQHGVRDHRRARRASSRRRSSRCRRSRTSRARRSTRLTQFARRHRPAGHAAAPGGARAVADAAGPRPTLAPDLKNAASSELDPLIDASKTGFPAAEQVLEDPRPLLAPARPGDRASSRPRSTSSGSTSAS